MKTIKAAAADAASFLVWALVVGLVVCGLASCSRHAETVEAGPPDPATCTDAGDGLYDCRLKDGTRCVVYAGYKAGGLDCDFKRERGPE